MKYSIGLDIGIESVGYSILELNSSDMPCRIVFLGARVFDRAEQPKTGESLAAPRREARGARRRLRRHRHRLERIYGLIKSDEILSSDELAHLYDGKLSDIYELRKKALDEPLTAPEFARVLIHIAQRRGFKSNRKAVDDGDKENGKLLSAVNSNKALCLEKGYRTVGEMMFLDEKFTKYKRNKSDAYSNTVDRNSVEDEIKLIFKAQRSFEMKFACENTEQRYLAILLSQRSFAEGPGSGPYSGNQIDRMVGKCTFEPDEYRAAKATYSFQVFNLWQHINHIRISDNTGTHVLTDTQRRELFNIAHKQAELSYAQIREILKIQDEAVFVGIRYTGRDIKAIEKKKKLNDLKAYHDIRKCLDKSSKTLFGMLSSDQLDAIGEALSKNLSDDDIKILLERAGICLEAVEQLIKLPNYAKYGHLSIKACKKIIPFLEEGMTYDKACEAAGYNFKNDNKVTGKYLPPLDMDDPEITSPVVKRAVSQSIKVINAIIRKMDETSPVYINIELARELSKNLDDRRKIEKAQNENFKENERLIEQIKELGIVNPTGQDLVKFKLWKEQDGYCPYSQESISIERLFEPGYVDVDHIIPYSRSFDDRTANKVLCMARENRQKGNRLPLEYLTGEKRDRYIVWVNNQNYRLSKKSMLLKEQISDENGWKQRNLQDTQFISSYLYSYIIRNLEFAQSDSGKIRRVYTVNGAMPHQNKYNKPTFIRIKHRFFPIITSHVFKGNGIK